MILSLFSGAGGCDVAAHSLGLQTTGVEISAELAAIAQAAGHNVQVRDVREISGRQPPAAWVDGLQGGPPCQTFSQAGKGAGRQRLAELRFLASCGTSEALRQWAASHDASYGLVLEPLRIALERIEIGAPLPWIALEQVQPVLPLWEAVAVRLASLGYGTVAGVLKAEEYGVPQTRRRAVMLARFGAAVRLPSPTHRAYRKGVPQHAGNPFLHPWVSMAEALGWGATERPSWTVCAGGTATGGAEPWGNGARRQAAAEQARGAWMLRSNYSDSGTLGTTAAERGRTMRDLGQPATTIASKGARWELRMSNNAHAAVRHESEPAATIVTGHAVNDMRLFPEGTARRGQAETAATRHPESRRLSVDEAACLQTFPDAYPWETTPTKGMRYLGIGNAVPPVMWAAVLREITR